MFKKLTHSAKNNPFLFIYGTISLIFIILFTTLFSFYILQSDDFYYASFFSEGFGNFFKLTANHFSTFNGRALVHFFAQISLALPPFFLMLINSAIVFFTGFFAYKLSVTEDEKAVFFIYMTLFYSLVALLGKNVLTEAVMWVSAFYNYVFPALITVLALYLCKTNKPLCYLFCFLSGATTEQWGICAVVMVFLLTFPLPFKKVKGSTLFKNFSPTLCSLLGYITIFLSPATRLRAETTGHTSVSGSLIDLPRLSEVFLEKGSGALILIIFICLTLVCAYIYKKNFSLLYSGILPLSLLLTLPLHKSFTATFILCVLYLVLCGVIFLTQAFKSAGIFVFGAVASVLIMMPTNTFESRITFPCLILIIFATLCLLFDLNLNKAKLFTPFALVFAIAAIIAFMPSYKGFMYNSSIEKENLSMVEKAKETNILNYNIDYDTQYTAKLMFNDAWIYSRFMSLHSLEDCKVILEGKSMTPLVDSDNSLSVKAISHNGKLYVPMRAFLEETGGTLTTENGVVMTLNNKTLTYTNGMFIYNGKDTFDHYIVADDNRLLNFYTLSIELSVVNDAFNLNIKAL